MTITKANANWSGSLKEGKGAMELASGAYRGPFSFVSRFERGAGPETGTNPEELLAAAHAGCFSMALSGQLTNAGHAPESIESTAAVTMERVDGAMTISKSHLVTKVKVDGISDEELQRLVQAAADTCPVSRALAGVRISVEASRV